MKINESKFTFQRKQPKKQDVPSIKWEYMHNIDAPEADNPGSDIAKPRLVDLHSTQKITQPIVVRYNKNKRTPGVEVYIVLKGEKSNLVKAEVCVVSSTKRTKINTTRIEKDTKKTISAIEAVNSEIEKDAYNRQRLLSMCSE